ncbi:related to RIM20 - protein involved in proteolytic activation of Rim101p [Melanopsichium pennsylvanicum]|uniref:Related to RIM20 - protein involved in proteolytic activation of Rim101p n=2 Tax=Melanopsichium pennsylvanicum TaxID=63383 RepID=A0AAJ4XMZ8_9BASI|nr:intracellular transporter [Melanopsichium pennsylvanicum 4]SNX85869.1 related to RIM20 - protein involved in proteolytic activation of Rim101p [Melanopsichium pennsylvanicum]
MPRNILFIPHKRTPTISSPLTTAIRNYISHNYTDTHPDAFSNDIRDFVRLRNALTSPDVHVSSIEPLLRYHAQLVFFSTKFPANITLSFPWTLSFPSSLPSWTSSISGAMEATKSAEAGPASGIAFATSDTVAHPDLAFERANVLFSLAALYSALGCSESRADKESIKRATAWFQQAAGILQYILDNLVEPIRHLSPPSSDLNPRLLSCIRDLMLAQAQECFWQKAVMDNMKDATIAKLAYKVADYYSSALHAVHETSEQVSGGKVDIRDTATITLPSGWENHLTVKRWHFAAAAQYRKACDDLASNRYGDELSRLHLAEQHLKKALDLAKRDVSDAIKSDLSGLQGILRSNIARATRDNDLIYLEPVTPTTQLAQIVPAAMVKTVVPVEVSQPIAHLRDSPAPAFGKPLFAELVPYGVHLAISIYEDRKDSLVRDTIAGRRDELDAIATSTLQSLNLPGSLQALEQPMGLPPSLLRKHEEVASEGGLERLHRIAQDVARIAATDRDMLSETLALIEHEEREDESVRASFSAQGWGRPPSSEVNTELKAQAAEYHDTLIKAAASDEIVRRKLDDWDDLIGVLGGNVEGLEAFVPSSNPSSVASSGSGGVGGIRGSEKQVLAVRALREVMEHLDDVLDSRSACVSEAKALAFSDDIRPLVMREAATLSNTGEAGFGMQVSAADFEHLFDKELVKYSRFTMDLDSSAKEQERLLDRVKECNTAFVEARKSDGTIQRREKALQNLDAAYGKYRELSSNLVEGLEFYNGLAKILSGYRDQCKEWTRARQVDLHWLIHRMGRVSVTGGASEDQQGYDGQGGYQHEEEEEQKAQSQVQHQQHVQTQPHTPARQTRSKARASQPQQQQQPHQSQQQQQQQQPSPPPPPQWGALPPGAKIQFRD